MAAERVPEPLGGRGGVVVEHLSTAITFVPLIQFQNFLKAYKETFQMKAPRVLMPRWIGGTEAIPQS